MKKYTKEILEKIAADATSVSGMMRLLQIRGGSSHSHITSLIKKYEIDVSHFQLAYPKKGSSFPDRRNKEDILVNRTNSKEFPTREKSTLLRRALTECGVHYICSVCGQEPLWNGKSLVLQIDHIDGNCVNDTLDNLRYLCPNCHTQTDNFCRGKKCPSPKEELVSLISKERPERRKFEVSKEELRGLIADLNWSQLGRHFGVSDNAVRKRARLLGLL